MFTGRLGAYTSVAAACPPPPEAPGGEPELQESTYTVDSVYSTYSGHLSDGFGLRDGVFIGAASVWASDGAAQPSWIQADLGSIVTVTKVEVSPIPVSFDNWGTSYLDGATIEASENGTDWTTFAASITGADNTYSEYTSSVAARYVRVWANYYWLALSEFKVYAGGSGGGGEFAILSSGGATGSVMQTIYGTAPAGSVVILSRGADEIMRVVADESGEWEAVSSLIPGSNEITATLAS